MYSPAYQLDWVELKKQLTERLADRAAETERFLLKIIPAALSDLGMSADDPQLEDVRDIAGNTERDLQRLRIYQEGQVDPLKFAAYLAFWFRKLKPIPRASRNSGGRVLDVNERLAIRIMTGVASNMLSALPQPDRQKAKAAFELFYANDGLNDYLIQSMRQRTFGPHHFLIVLKMILGREVEAAIAALGRSKARA